MQQHHAIVAQEFGTFAEIGLVIAEAGMLEHAYADDAIEGLDHVAIICELE